MHYTRKPLQYDEYTKDKLSARQQLRAYTRCRSDSPGTTLPIPSIDGSRKGTTVLAHSSIQAYHLHAIHGAPKQKPNLYPPPTPTNGYDQDLLDAVWMWTKRHYSEGISIDSDSDDVSHRDRNRKTKGQASQNSEILGSQLYRIKGIMETLERKQTA